MTTDTDYAELLTPEVRREFGSAAYFIGPNPGKPRWLLVATAGVVGSTLGRGETPRAAFEDAKRIKAGA